MNEFNSKHVGPSDEEDLGAYGFHEESGDDSVEDDELGGTLSDFDDGDDEGNDESDLDSDSESDSDDYVSLSKNKVVIIKKLLENIRDNNEKLIALLGGLVSPDDEARIGVSEMAEGEADVQPSYTDSENVIEGVFDGQNMIGPDGKQYSIPANYASKSKLVEGDMLKLTITDRGAFVYKQTKPVERRRVIGVLEKEEDGNFFVNSDGNKWRVLTASITYFKGAPGDKAVVLIPSSGDSQWGAVENVIRNG
jgi:hypothetical protein